MSKHKAVSDETGTTVHEVKEEKYDLDFFMDVARAGIADYYCANWGENFGVYPDGHYLVSTDTGCEIDENERPIVVVECPGISNLDTTPFTEGWTADLGNGVWKVGGTGEEIDLAECIRRCCVDGDVDEDIEALAKELFTGGK